MRTDGTAHNGAAGLPARLGMAISWSQHFQSFKQEKRYSQDAAQI
jgi:hypothetical protein